MLHGINDWMKTISQPVVRRWGKRASPLSGFRGVFARSSNWVAFVDTSPPGWGEPWQSYLCKGKALHCRSYSWQENAFKPVYHTFAYWRRGSSLRKCALLNPVFSTLLYYLLVDSLNGIGKAMERDEWGFPNESYAKNPNRDKEEWKCYPFNQLSVLH